MLYIKHTDSASGPVITEWLAVPGGAQNPSQAAGLQLLDLVVQFEGTVVRNVNDLGTAGRSAANKEKDVVTFIVRRVKVFVEDGCM